jgi:hypothetical protein
VDPVRWRGKSRHPFLRVRVCDSSPLLLNAAVELRSRAWASAHGGLTPLTRKSETLGGSNTIVELRGITDRLGLALIGFKSTLGLRS